MSLLSVLKETGFYLERRTFTAPLAKRQRASFGTAKPIEMPTAEEVRGYSEG